ncbi:MAG: phosphoglucosamine mutase [Planctomycetota bacterium]
MGERLFGTDGIRGKAGEGWLHPERVSLLGRSVGRVLGGGRALLGHDGRHSGPELEAALARGLSAAGFECVSAGLITTPGLAIVGRLRGFDVTAMLSASHNPAEDNGIKLFDSRGEKLADEVEDAIETEARAGVESGEVWPDVPAPTLDPTVEDDYLGHVLGSAGELKLDGLTVVLDCANGGGSRVAPRVFGRLGAHVITTAGEPDGDNINDGCGATQPAALQEAVRRHSADVGIALDGDGDRCILVDEHGGLVHGDGILTLVARHAKARGELADPRIVATVMSNKGLHRALREVDVSVVTVDVGDRRVVEGLRAENLALGGEQSGHIVFGADNFYIGDGVYTALRVLRVLRESGASLSELASPYQPFPQVLINVPVARKPALGELSSVMEAVRSIEADLADDGRVLLRYSGTEDLARVMVEGPDPDWIQTRAQELAAIIAREIGQEAPAS